MKSWMLIAALAAALATALAGLWFSRRRAAQQMRLAAPAPLPGLPQPIEPARRFRAGGAPATGWPSTLTGVPHD